MKAADLAALGYSRDVLSTLDRRGIVDLLPIQVMAVEKGLCSGSNLLVSAPTSAGKTLMGELACVAPGRQGTGVYLVSHRALAGQIHDLFQTWYVIGDRPLLRCGIATGEEDTVRGEYANFDVVVATYEKFYGSVVTDSALLGEIHLVVADELQLVGESARGPLVEMLLARTRRMRSDVQILGLTATIPNLAALGDWLGCSVIEERSRTPPLTQEVWIPRERLVFDDDETIPPRTEPLPADVGNVGAVVEQMLADGLGPVAVMATQINYALAYAHDIGQHLPADESQPVELGSEFFDAGEGTPEDTRAANLLRRRVGLHHRNLTLDQRRIVERGLLARQLDVVVATPTLVAGVNLPFRSVLYPRVTRYDGTSESPISRAEVTNGAGRAGRRGLHEKGTVVFLAQSRREALNVAWRYIHGLPDQVESQLDDRSLAYRILHVLAGSDPMSTDDIIRELSLTLWGHERSLGDESNAGALRAQVETELARETHSPLWSRSPEGVRLTDMGRSVAASGLEPAPSLQGHAIARRLGKAVADGIDLVLAREDALVRLLSVDGSHEYLPNVGRMRRPLAARCLQVTAAIGGRTGSRLGAREALGLGHALVAIGEGETMGAAASTLMGERSVRSRLCDHLARVMRVGGAMVVAEGAPALLPSARLAETLADQLDFQCKEDAVPFEKCLRAHPVRGLGRKRRARLGELCGGELGRVFSVDAGQLAAVVHESRVNDLREAILRYWKDLSQEHATRQLRDSAATSVAGLVVDLLGRFGKALEPTVVESLRHLGLDADGIEQQGNEALPDIEGKFPDGEGFYAEVKAAENEWGEVGYRDAREISETVTEEFAGTLLTVGRTIFNERALREAFAQGTAPRYRLVTVGALIEMLLAIERGVQRERVHGLLRGPIHVDVAHVRRALYRQAD